MCCFSRHPMTHLCEPRKGEYTGIILTNTNVSYGMVDEEREKEGEREEYDYSVVRAPQPHLPSHPQLESALTDSYEEPYDAPKHHRQAPAMDIPLIPQDGCEKGAGEALYEPMP